MKTDITLPQLAGEMTAARLSTWLKKEGDHVEAGEPIVEFETDKTNMELEAPASGILSGIRIAAGTDAVPVGAILAIIVNDGPGRQTEPQAEVTGVPVADIAPKAAPITDHIARSSVPVVPSPHDGFSIELPPVRGATGHVRATPLAERMARLAGIDLAMLQPTSAGGRITKADVEAVLQKRATRPAHEQAAFLKAAAQRSTNGGFRDVPLSAMRRTTAARLMAAKRTIPHFYLETSCRVDNLLALRRDLNESLADLRISVTDLLVFAAARALVRVPQANSAWNDDSVRLFADVDIAVAVNTTNGLVTPVVRSAQTKSLTELARELKELVVRAKAGSLRPEDYSGGTFTISNLGMFAVTSILPILNPPQACILGVGAIERLPLVTENTVTAGSVMNCTLAADHRAIEGAGGAELLTELRRLLENPVLLALFG